MIDFSQLNVYRPDDSEKLQSAAEADLCIYGATPAAITAAVQAASMGASVVIAEAGFHLGGTTAGGLGKTDFGVKDTIGGLARQFYREMGEKYGGGEADGAVFLFEPSAATEVFQRWLDRAGVKVYYGQYLRSVTKRGGRITELVMENGNVFRGKMFIDATYEGDLMARSGVAYHVGREANSVYQETYNGIQFGSPTHRFNAWIDPYVIPGKPDSGLLPGVSDEAPGVQGQGDKSVQAYNFRICLTNVPDNRLPFPEPPGYDPKRFTLLERYLRAGVWDAVSLNSMLQHGKTDLNNHGAVSTDHIGANHAWPEADYKTREAIFQDHVNYNLGMLYFLSYDDSVPSYIREEMRQWGLAGDEFMNTANWPHQLYIREGRRMISDVVINENHCRHYAREHDAVAIASYKMDSHNCRRLVIDGCCVNEGNVEVMTAGPYPISYRAIVPKGEQCTNLLVPVCLSSSHIAYGSLRLEPVFLMLGQSAGTAAVLAMESDCAIQDVDYEALRRRLEQDGQLL
ncbi:FAD-dependent oxidoreductase [Paenibacillus sp. J5C_2022]|uniref:FAD-dependent oxidoreductase n=1 Tax=Paenibacillus sp. J5C2022 TaxID=2977129 RepID=UPI0021CFABE9|nr:FAD-dependent oxidoreductase [Paenibacillus sp. J5C2022]MCU6712159.1 FAD-dependent oxidoreductase [Paenibacillus sp. J5C2022]